MNTQKKKYKNNISQNRFPFETATVGGTFHAMHIGHERYIEIGFGIAEKVYVHVTSDEYAKRLKNYSVKPYKIRLAQVQEFLDRMGWSSRSIIQELNSENTLRNFCMSSDFSVAVVEPKYFEFFKEMNLKRKQKELEQFCILLKPRTVVSSNIEISSAMLED